MPSITVVIAVREKVSHATCLSLLQAEPGIRVVGEARNGLEAIAAIARLKPRILLLDLNLVPEIGAMLLPVLQQKSPRTKVLLLIGRVAESRILEALARGARGYLEKKALRTFLPKAVRVVDAGEAWVPRKMVARIIDRLVRLEAQTDGTRRPFVRGGKQHSPGRRNA